MNDNFFNPFIDSSKYIIQEVANIRVRGGGKFERKSPFNVRDFSVIFGIIGQVKGHAIFTLNEGLGCKIASAMMGGQQINSLDELAKSAISEMGNMIMGHAANKLYSSGINIDFTPPSVLVGNKISFSTGKMEIVSLPIFFDDDEALEVNIVYIPNEVLK